MRVNFLLTTSRSWKVEEPPELVDYTYEEKNLLKIYLKKIQN